MWSIKKELQGLKAVQDNEVPMPYDRSCLIKQVPDTRNVTSNVLREDGTVNRQALIGKMKRANLRKWICPYWKMIFQ